MTVPATLREIYRMPESEAHDNLCYLRWPESDGEETCPRCHSVGGYVIKSRRQFECKACKHHYSLLSDTLLSHNKLSYSDLMALAFVFTRSAKGISSIQLANTAGVQQRTAWRAASIFREAIAKEIESLTLCGTVEIDGATFGGHIRLMNCGLKGNSDEKKYTRRFNERAIIVVAKQRMGRTVPLIVDKESAAKKRLTEILAHDTVLVCDGAHAWDSLQSLYNTLRVQHAWSFAANNACTNNAESYFSAMRKMHDGTHHWMSKEYMRGYASELAWKRDMSELRLSNEEKTNRLLSLCLGAKNDTL